MLLEYTSLRGSIGNDRGVVSIGRLTAFYVVLVPLDFIPSEPPLYAYIMVCFVLCKKAPLFSFEILSRDKSGR